MLVTEVAELRPGNRIQYHDIEETASGLVVKNENGRIKIRWYDNTRELDFSHEQIAPHITKSENGG
jgi:membrane carboxypeptidase/penicillin-binding protein PbpC